MSLTRRGDVSATQKLTVYSRSRLSKKTDGQTDIQTDGTDYISTPHSRVVSNQQRRM